MRVAYYWRSVAYLGRIAARTQMQYRGAFWVSRVAQVAAYAASFAGMYILLARFQNLGGWAWPELALLFGFQLVAYALGASLSFVQWREVEEMVRLGTFDALLVKPISPWTYLVFSGINFDYLGHLVLGISMIVLANATVPLRLSLGTLAELCVFEVSAAMIIFSLLTVIGASALVLVRSQHLYPVFFGLWELAKYPLGIYPATLQVTLLTILPFGFMGYVPVAVLLGKPVPLLGTFATGTAMLVGPLSLVLTVLAWRWVIRRYQGAGG